DPLVPAQAIHLHEELVQRVLLLPASIRTAAAATQRIELVDEDDARRLGPRLLDEITHPARSHPDVHLGELRAGGDDHWPTRLPRHRARQQGLPRAGRADE